MREEFNTRDNESNTPDDEMSGWQGEFNHMILLRQKAQHFEKDSRLAEAISVYLFLLLMAEHSNHLVIHNYVPDIDKVIYLYGKTRQIDLLKDFLAEQIKIHPGSNKIQDWTDRLCILSGDQNTPLN